MPRVFLVTGASSGFGAELVRVIISQGDIAVATARDPSKLNFENSNKENYLALALDVTVKSTIQHAFEQALDKFGRIDVVVNNAGYGLCGIFEGLTEEQIHHEMQVNFFGLLDVTRLALKTMREQNPPGGVIQQITSVGGQIGVPMLSLYCASKWAVEGFTESLQAELNPQWGIRLTCIEPGGFKTDFSNRSLVFGDEHPAYVHLKPRELAQLREGKQPGDVRKAAKAFYELAIMKEPPLRCLIGTDAYIHVKKKLESQLQNIETMASVTNGTNLDGIEVKPPGA